MDARGDGGNLLAVDQGGAAQDAPHPGLLTLFAHPWIAPISAQQTYEFAMILSNPSLCKLSSLDVFKDDIPQVPKY